MKRRRNRRQDTRLLLLFAAGGLFAAALVGLLLSNRAMVTDFSQKNLPPASAIPSAPTGWGGTCSPAPWPGCP